jgi:hypothetical protein
MGDEGHCGRFVTFDDSNGEEAVERLYERGVKKG